MSARTIIFRDGRSELVLPVTPASYQVEKGMNVETVNIHQIGDVTFAGYGTLATIKLSCIFPANDYDFARSSDPWRYVDWFKKRIEKKARPRFIVSETGINIPVLVQSISYGEQDGTNDVYAELTLRESPVLKAARVTSPKQNLARDGIKIAAASITSYDVKYGDTLCSICRRYYGDDSPATYNKLAQYNNKPNPNILYAGETLLIPQPLQ